jgi:hypothetical protein
MRPDRDLAPALGVLLDLLADRIASRIRTAAERETYDARHLPQCCSRRRFAEVLRSGCVVGAHREGKDWACSRAAWGAARSHSATKRNELTGGTAPRDAPQRMPARHEAQLAQRADELLRRAGLRVVGHRRTRGAP